MRTLWNAVSVIAIANLLALAGFVGWLVVSARLNSDRVQAFRATLAETIPAQVMRETKELAAAEAASKPLDDSGNVIPISAQQLVGERMEAVRIDRQRTERLRREVDDLRRTLTRERVAIDKDRDELKRERGSFAAMRTRLEEIEGSEQFQNALSVLQGLKPEPAKELLVEEMARSASLGESESGRLRIIAYLDALPNRSRVKIMGEFVKDDPALAAELLEGLRTKGLAPLVGASDAAGDRNSGTSAEPSSG